MKEETAGEEELGLQQEIPPKPPLWDSMMRMMVTMTTMIMEVLMTEAQNLHQVVVTYHLPCLSMRDHPGLVHLQVPHHLQQHPRVMYHG